MPVTWKIDWLTFSKNRWEVETAEIDNSASALAWASIAAQEIGLWITEYRRTRGTPFYPWAFECMLSGIKVFVPKDVGVQGIMIQFSGKVLSGKINPANIIHAALDHKWHVTRIDVAVDFMEAGLTVEDVHEEFLLNSRRENRTIGWIESRSGNTFTIGSRQSERYARIYDKGKEQKLDHVWTRVELEYKGRAALLASECISRGDAGALHDMAAFFQESNPKLASAIAGLTTEPGTKFKLPGRPPSDRALWFSTQVAAALRAWASEDYDNARAWLTDQLWTLDEGI